MTASAEAVRVPGPASPPLLGLLGRMRRDPLALFTELSRDHGDLVRMDFALRRACLANHPRHVKRVLQDNWKAYPLPSIYGKSRPVLGKGLLMAEGAEWASHRRMMQPAFAHGKLAGLKAIVEAETEALLAEWDRDKRAERPFDLVPEMMRLSLRVTVKALFGTGIPDAGIVRVGAAMKILAEEVNRRYYSLADLPAFLPTPRNLRFKRALADLEAEVRRVIGAARENPDRPADLLSMLLAARDEETGEALGERQIRDEAVNLFLAGHETVTLALGWLWHLVAVHPEAGERLGADADRAAAAGPGDREAASLPFARAAVQESLRLYPPVWSFAREAGEDDVLEPYRVRKGTLIFLCPYAMHRDPRFWPGPERFDPERFLGARAEEIPRFAYFPFGGGPRVCIGQHFALLQAATAASLIARRWRFAPAGTESVALEAGITLRPRHGVMVRASRR